MKTSNKYNRHEIMKNAWSFFFAEMGSFSSCLKEAWSQAKNAVKVVVLNSVKDVFESLKSFNYKAGLRSDLANAIILKVSKEGFNVAQKIAEQFAYNENEMTEKQAWCVAYEYMRISK